MKMPLSLLITGITSLQYLFLPFSLPLHSYLLPDGCFILSYFMADETTTTRWFDGCKGPHGMLSCYHVAVVLSPGRPGCGKTRMFPFVESS